MRRALYGMSTITGRISRATRSASTTQDSKVRQFAALGVAGWRTERAKSQLRRFRCGAAATEVRLQTEVRPTEGAGKLLMLIQRLIAFFACFVVGGVELESFIELRDGIGALAVAQQQDSA